MADRPRSEPTPQPQPVDAQPLARIVESSEELGSPTLPEAVPNDGQPALPTPSVWRIYLEQEPIRQPVAPTPAAATPVVPVTPTPAPAASAPQNPARTSAAPAGQLEAKARWAKASVTSACELGERRLLYSTRARLQDALEQLAQSLDEAAGGKQHTADLDAALEALREADDFFPRQSGLPFDKDTARIARRHRSPAAASLPAESSSGQAIRHYYSFAAERLSAAFAAAPAASGVLWALGKTYVELSREPDSLVVNGRGKALVFQGAAVAVDPSNWRAANELGVLLAKAGRWEDAAAALRKSVAAQGSPEAWHNLAVVTEHLGQKQEAEDARRHSVALGYRPDQKDKPAVEWVSPAALGATARSASEAASSTKEGPSAAASPAKASEDQEKTPPATARRLLDWLPWRSANQK